MAYFTKIGPQIFYSFPLVVKEAKKLDAYLDLLEASGIGKLLSTIDTDEFQVGRPSYNACDLFAAILYCFSTGHASLREMETAFRTDLRLIYFLKGERPSSPTISRFINALTPHIDYLFVQIVKAIFKKFGADMDTVFLDGSKWEANANKYKFVWKPTTFHLKLSDKARNLLNTLGLSKDVPGEGILPSAVLMKKVQEAQRLQPDSIKGGQKALNNMIQNLSNYLLKALEYEEKERICGPNRNSYYKTDHDATAMCLKRDYYSGLGSNMHAAYNTQILVSKGLIVSYYLCQERNDLATLEPSIDKFRGFYGHYPERLVADAGYGTRNNYEYCDRYEIKAFIKYQSWSGESSGRNPAVYEYLEDGSIKCLGGRIGLPTKIANRHPTRPDAVFYLVQDCQGCPFMIYCRRFMKEKTGEEKIFEVQPQYMKLKQKARDLLLTAEGIEMRVNRSCQVEGTFGILKQNMGYTRFRRRSLENVTTEFALTCLGVNIRKYLKYAPKGSLPAYWQAPKNLQPGQFKKPSAKRLANRVLKRRKKQPNEVARDGYSHKDKGM